jgi:photosystem II stability/assembly factor-like uncharacterized protein
VRPLLLSFLVLLASVGQSQIKNICKDKDADWKPIGPVGIFKGKQNFQGIIISVASRNGKEIFAGSNSGGLFKTTDGENWTNLTDQVGLPGLGIQDIALGKQRPGLILLATGVSTYGRSYGQGILYSTNGGQNWSVVKQFNPGLVRKGICRRALLNPSNDRNAYVAVDGEVWMTQRLGEEQAIWRKIFALPEGEGIVYEMKFHPQFASNGILYISSAKGKSAGQIHRINTIDGSSTNVTPPKAPQSFRTDIAVCDSKPDRLYVLFNKPGSGFSLHISEDRGKTYAMNRPMNAFGMGMAGFEMEVSPQKPDRIYFGGISMHRLDGLRQKTPGKIQGSQHDDIRDILVLSRAGKEMLICGNDGGVSVNGEMGNAAWTHLTGKGLTGLNISQFYGIDISEWDPNLFTGGLQDNGTIVWKKGQIPRHMYGGDGGDCVALPHSDKLVMANYNSGASPGGLVKMDLTRAKANSVWKTSFGSSLSPIVQAEYDDNKILYSYAKAGNPPTYGLHEYDVNGSVDRVLHDSKRDVKAIANAQSDPRVIYIAKLHVTYGREPEDILLRSDDGGKSWKDVSANLDGSKSNRISHIAVSPTNPMHVWVSYLGFKTGDRVYRSTDGGLTWENVSYGLPDVPVNRLLILDNRQFAATDFGIYTRSGLGSWKCFSNGLPSVIVSDLEYDRCTNTLYAATFGRGVWQTAYPYKVTPSKKTIQFTRSDTIGSNQVWDHDILIRKGAELYIGSKQGVQVKVMRGQRVILEKGAKLTLENVNISAPCGGSWRIQSLSSKTFGKRMATSTISVVGNKVKIENLENKAEFPMFR